MQDITSLQHQIFALDTDLRAAIDLNRQLTCQFEQAKSDIRERDEEIVHLQLSLFDVIKENEQMKKEISRTQKVSKQWEAWQKMAGQLEEGQREKTSGNIGAEGWGFTGQAERVQQQAITTEQTSEKEESLQEAIAVQCKMSEPQCNQEENMQPQKPLTEKKKAKKKKGLWRRMFHLKKKTADPFGPSAA